MKLTWKQIDPFVKKPDPKARVILIYGPDNGLMKERARSIAKTICPDLEDPFQVVTLNGDALLEDTARLNDEAFAFSMLGGARVIRIEEAGDKIATIIKEYLEKPSMDNLVVLEAGDLGPRSALRLLCEKDKSAAALPCYVDDERGTEQIIRATLTENGFRIAPDALHLLSSTISGDRAKIRNELDKLMLYMGAPSGMITREDVAACNGDIAESSLDDLIYAVAGSRAEAALTAYHRLLKEGTADIVILRSLQNHFKRLHYTQAMIAAGQTTEEALGNLHPPLFFKIKDSFKAQLQKWTLPKLNMVLTKLEELEAQSKKTGTPVETLCAQAILAFSVLR